MHGRQSVRGLHSNSQNLDERKWPILIKPVLQRRPSHIRHDKIGQPLYIRHAVNFHHIVVNHCGGRLCLTRKPLPCRSAAAQMRCQHLDRNIPIEGGIKRFEHDAHSARPDHSHDFISPHTAQHPIVIRRRQQLEHRGVAIRRPVAARRRIERAGSPARESPGNGPPRSDSRTSDQMSSPAAAASSWRRQSVQSSGATGMQPVPRRSTAVAGTARSASDRMSSGCCSRTFPPANLYTPPTKI